MKGEQILTGCQVFCYPQPYCRRDINKAKEAGITPEVLEHGIGYKEAKEIYVCKIIYIERMKREIEPLYL